ncbi:putative T7SS-secreted protein [Streptomyces sp. NPDC059037]|uniref:putative T7SS-secreted protein n=1 Tax=Streptomyces sp. NPDC059037 TaxID=3346710 RepID=UPI00369D3AB5
MTYDPAAATTLPSNSPARRNGPLPQGMKSSPEVPNPDYPDLGFNPVPGDTETVEALRRKLVDCATTLQETHGVVTRLMDGSYWKGDAAVAFREQIEDGPLPKNLKDAANSIGKAAKHLHRWHGELDDFQRRAKRLNQAAKDARVALEAEKGRAERAGDDPDLDEEGAARHDDAKKALRRANGQVQDAQDELDGILKRARGLASEHEERANYRAGKIRDATHRLAPNEPGLFDRATDWVKENLPDILSALAGVVALVAIVFSGPLGIAMVAALMLASSALSAGALGARVWDPEVRASLMDGVTKREFDADFWSNAVSVGADGLGMVPGLVAVVKGGVRAARAVRASSGAMSLGQQMATFGTKTMDEARTIAALDNRLIARLVRGVSDPAKAAKAVATGSGSLGVGTANFGLIDSALDGDDTKVKDGAVAGIDGARLGLDSGGVLSLARHAFS